MKRKNESYIYLKLKMAIRMVVMPVAAVALTLALYNWVWSDRGGDAVVVILQNYFHMDYSRAMDFYGVVFRSNATVIFVAVMVIIFLALFFTFMNWVAKYFYIVNQGIEDLLEDDARIALPSELSVTERKLNAVKSELKQRALEAELANRRKNELVMYLAHDIRTPLTSVIGYLNLLSEAPDMPVEQRAKYTNITLEKAERLESMISEFFEITRYNMQQIDISKEKTDLYYMLVQLSDELLPVLSERGNTVRLEVDEELTVYGDPDKLARVFNNVLKNAAVYSFPNTEIVVSAAAEEDEVTISFKNSGKTIPKEKLAYIFEKFYRLDEARTSNTGGAGLGLAIAKDIVSMHGGTIIADSADDTMVFTVTLPNR